ncbi:SH2 domain-containing protein [Coprinopsis sp. MPI-PUGE-AT-0042]|nr:SH2 domain-containing protein [Coprinopsis sp. MPI-PUGE-AT-0042]
MAASTPEMFLSSNFNPSPNLDSLRVNPSYSLIQHIATQSSFHSALNQLLAQGLVAKITAIGGSLVNREQLITEAVVLATKIVLNSVGFLRITRYHHDTQKHGMEDVNGPDSLGDTRIQFADYELARKMATDALELDEEDIHDEHPFHAVSLIMNDHDRERKLMELDLDEFAISRYEANQDQKRHTLSLIRDELLRPFADMRPIEVVQRISKQFVAVKLESGIEGIVNAQYTANIPDDPHKLVKKGQMVPSVIIDIKFDLDQDHVFVELSIREKELLDGGQTFRRVFHDEHWNHTRYEKDKDNLERKKRQQSSGSQRVIKHSNFHDFNASQAEVYLEKQQRGDAGIRPSSRGREHLAVTWEPNICSDVTDRNPDPTGQSVGNQLVIEANHVYSDLDKLVVNHAQAMSRKVELERMVRDGFIADEDEDEDDDEDEEKEKERRRRHKHRIREEYEQMELEEDELEFLEENTRISVRNGLSRLRRGRESDPPLAGLLSKRRAIADSSYEDLDRGDAQPRA